MRYIFLLILSFFLCATSSSLANQKELELLNQGGKIIFIRHAYAPGVGDPLNFSLEDCKTQRNLNQQGIEQSILLGEIFQENNISFDKVFSSQWCRCKDTALYAFGDYQELKLLNSTFSNKYQKNHSRQMKDLEKLIFNLKEDHGNIIFITHYVIIGGILDYYPSSGEMVITDKSLKVLGSIETIY
jgi:phosphohistidine phosphatase SixA